VEAIASSLEKVVAEYLRRVNDAPVLAWPVVCGSRVAMRTCALSFRSGVLSVEVPDRGWRTELMHLAPRYLAGMNRYSPVPVERIEFMVAGRQCQDQDHKDQK
jgi:hypothetical protein